MAPRAASACLVGLLLLAGVARAQPCDCGCDDDCPPPPLLTPPPPGPPPPLTLEPPGASELKAVQGTAIAVGIAAWAVTTALASQQLRYLPTVDSIPVFGGIDAAVHNSSRDAPLLLFMSSAQVMSILVAVVAGLELAEERQRWQLAIGGYGAGAGVMLGGSF